MKLIAAGKDSYSFALGDREKRLLMLILQLYPIIPLDHQKLSRGATRPEDQQMLQEALSAQRESNRRQIEALMTADGVFVGDSGGWKLTLNPSHMETVLQVLNDIRIGSWILLGSPDGPAEILAALNEETAPHLWAMEVSGQFQINLLQALDGSVAENAPPPPEPTQE